MTRRIGAGMLAGFIATGVLSICMLIKGAVVIVPQGSAIQALVKVSTLWLGAPLAPWIGWLEHFFIGTVLWGIAFAVIQPALPGYGWMRGVAFSVGPWILMMVLLMPPAGAGWFGSALGYGVPLATLVLHFIYGAVLGAVYGFLMSPRRSELRAAAG
jgi:hypothetical protein